MISNRPSRRSTPRSPAVAGPASRGASARPRASAIRAGVVIGAAAAALTGCAEPIAPAPEPDRPAAPAPDPLDPSTIVPTGPVTTVARGDGSLYTVIDGSSRTEWVHVDFDTGAQTAAAGPWDLRVRRFHLSANGGVSGPGGVAVAAIADHGLDDDVTAAAAGAAWITDAADGPDPDADPDYAFSQAGGWYDYDPTTHVLTPRPMVWLVRTTASVTLKVVIERYYDAAGSPGWLRLRWRQL
jgi:hypothetical protein